MEMSSNYNQMTLALSRSTRTTLKGWKPGHAGGGFAAPVSPAFPLEASFPS